MTSPLNFIQPVLLDSPAKANEPKPESIKKQVDDLSWNIGNAIRDFRSLVESVFDEHCQAAERLEAQYQLEQAKLSAENARLRGMLGLKASPALYQGITLEPINGSDKQKVQALRKSTSKSSSKRQSKLSSSSKRNDVWAATTQMARDGDVFASRGNAKKVSSGGSWEHFVAWVPTGAALGCSQPWTPLPNDALEQSTPTGRQVSPQGEDSDEDESDAEDEVKWKVLETWKTSKQYLAVARAAAATKAAAVERETSATNIILKSFAKTKTEVRILSNVPPSVDGPLSETPFGEKSSLSSEEKEQLVNEAQSATQNRCYMVHPTSVTRIIWDVCSLALVLYDLVMIPLSVFSIPNSLFLEVMAWTTRMFWTLDMVLSVLTGQVLKDGRIEMRLPVIVRQYLKTWFILDTIIVLSDWIEYGLFQGGSGQGMGRIAKVFRVVRTVRLLRLARMKQVLMIVTERLQSEQLFFLVNVAKLVILLMTFGHVVACIWWSIGSRGNDNESDAWTWRYGYQQASFQSQYLMSLHWTLSMFSGGMDEVRPAAPVERGFAVLLWMVAFVLAAVVTSMLTSSLVQLHIIGGTQARQVSNLRKYLFQNRISKNLSLRIQRSAKYALSGDLSPDAVELLPVVSEQLRLEMHTEMFSSLLQGHNFFAACHREGPQVLRRICHLACSVNHMYSGDVIFHEGETPSDPKMYFIYKGQLEYVHKGATLTCLDDRHWISEAVLWTYWTHRGTLKALEDSKLAQLNATTFVDIIDHFKDYLDVGLNVKVYAADFCAQLNWMESESFDAITDLVSSTIESDSSARPASNPKLLS